MAHEETSELLFRMSDKIYDIFVNKMEANISINEIYIYNITFYCA